jgi:hypothetical protein
MEHFLFHYSEALKSINININKQLNKYSSCFLFSHPASLYLVSFESVSHLPARAAHDGITQRAGKLITLDAAMSRLVHA